MPTTPRHCTLLCCLLAVCCLASAAPAITLEPCPRDLGVVGAKCGALEVFENREAGQGRTISLNIAVLPALGRSQQPDPLFVLSGGPGTAATEMARLFDRSMRRIRHQRDIVLVDQRGTGKSNPLDCESVDPDSALHLPTEDIFEPLKTCLQGLDADPRFYTTPVAMDDLD